MDGQLRRYRTRIIAQRTVTPPVLALTVAVVLAVATTKTLSANSKEDCQCLRQATVLQGSSEAWDGKENGRLIDAVGTRFEITNSRHLNVTLLSSENVRVCLESLPGVVTLHIGRNCPESVALLTMTGLEANKKYYRYQDGNLEEVFIADGNGSHFFAQDISTHHHVFIQERKSTIYIRPDGGIDPSTAPISQDGNIYTLTNDIYESLHIQKSGITLDGAGHGIESNATHGIYLWRVSDVTIQNVVVRNSSYGIYVGESNANTIANNTVSHCNDGIFVHVRSYDNDVHHNNVSQCGFAGIRVRGALDESPERNSIRQNILSDNFIGIYSDYGSYYNTIHENEVYRGGNCGLMMWTTFRNEVTHNIFQDCGYGIGINWGWWGEFEGNVIENCSTGMGIWQSYSNSFVANIVKDCGVTVDMDMGTVADWNVFYHNDFVGDNIVYAVLLNNVWDNGAGEGNYWSNYGGLDDGSGIGRFGEPRIAGDGVGDTDVPHLGVDWYPSMRPWVLNLNQAPVADAGGPYLLAVDQTIALDGSGSCDPDGDALTYFWTEAEGLGDFDDTTLQNPYLTGIRAGVTELELWVSDGVDIGLDWAMLVVYNPDGGFVTGGGWIASPANEGYRYMTVGGKANFGFVSKYQKGATVPTGQTEFVFQAGDLNFHSSSYDWLVVNQNGSNAQFKGSGTINGSGNYKFMLWATDGAPDTFRIKIWQENGGEIMVYDNGFNQPIGGGSIVVHTK